MARYCEFARWEDKFFEDGGGGDPKKLIINEDSTGIKPTPIAQILVLIRFFWAGVGGAVKIRWVNKLCVFLMIKINASKSQTNTARLSER